MIIQKGLVIAHNYSAVVINCYVILTGDKLFQSFLFSRFINFYEAVVTINRTSQIT